MLFTDIAMLKSYRDLYLWNPCVGTHRTLVSTCFKKVIDDFFRCFCLVGFGFNEASNDYRVVRIFYARDKVSPLKVEVYSVGKHTWRRIKDPVVTRQGSADGVYANGSFYWLETTFPTTVYDLRYNNSEDLWILSFDFETEVFGDLKVPRKVALCIGTTARFRLMEFEGSLALCVFGVLRNSGVTTRPYLLWLMRQDNGVVSWNLRFRAALKEGGWPIAITKGGTLLLEVHPFEERIDITKILSVNLNTMHHRDLGFGKPEGVDDSTVAIEPCTVDTSFTESLVMYEGGKSLSKFAK